MNLSFFQVLQSTLLKNEKNLLKKDANQLKIAWDNKRQKKDIEKRERKTRNEKKSNNDNKYFWNIFLSIWKYLVYIVTFVLQFRTLTQNIWQQTRYFYVDCDSNRLLLLFYIYFILCTFNLELKQKHLLRKTNQI